MTTGSEEKLLKEVQTLKWTCVGLIVVTLAILLYAMVTISRVTIDVYDKVTELRVMVEGVDARMKSQHRHTMQQHAADAAKQGK